MDRGPSQNLDQDRIQLGQPTVLPLVLELEEEAGIGRSDPNQELGSLRYYLKRVWRRTTRERGRSLLRIVQSGKRGQTYRIFDYSLPGCRVDNEELKNLGSIVFTSIKCWNPKPEIRSLSVAVAMSDETRISNVGVKGRMYQSNEPRHSSHHIRARPSVVIRSYAIRDRKRTRNVIGTT